MSISETELRERLDTAVNEWREVARVAESVSEAIDQAKDALDAELSVEALEDALSNWRLIDYSGPEKESDRIKELDELESAIDDLLSDTREAEEEDDDDEEDEDEFSAESYLRGAIDALNARNDTDAISHIAKALEKITTS